MKRKYKIHTLVYFNKNCLFKYKKKILNLGKKAFIVTGKNSSKTNGSLDDLIKVLKLNNQEYFIYDKITENPNVLECYDAKNVLKENNCDFVIGLGGGSPLDASKIIALLAVQDVSVDDLFSNNFDDKRLNALCIPTTCGTGSEVTKVSVLTNDKLQTKMAVAKDFLQPDLALLDYNYLKFMPENILYSTLIDALTHLIEGYLSIKGTDYSRKLAIKGFKAFKCIFNDIRKNKSPNYKKYEYASNIAGVVIYFSGTTTVHAMGYSITYFKGIPHGFANLLVLFEYLRFIYDECEALINEMLDNLGFNSIIEFEDFINKITSKFIKQYSFNDLDIEKYSLIAIKSKNNLSSPKKIVKDDILKIYKKSFKIE